MAHLQPTGCAGSCLERGQDWFEHERPNLDHISTVVQMVGAGEDLVEDFLKLLGLEPADELVVRGRLAEIAARPIIPEPKAEL